jgi:archaellum component FlaC
LEYKDEFTDMEDKIGRFKKDVDLAGSEFTLLLQKAITIMKENEHQYEYESNISDILDTAKMLLELMKYEKGFVL